MVVKEIRAKSLLSYVKQPDTWFGLKFNMNLYRGCHHQCIYCDSRSECYQIENFADILYKGNALELLEKALSRKRVKGTIGTGSMNDPYMPIEKKLELTRGAMRIIARYRFPVHILTKSDLVLRDLDLLEEISRVFALVSFTITTADDDLAAILEPGAPPPTARLAAIRELASRGINTGVLLMPVLPFLEDSKENLSAVIEQSKAAGAKFVLPALGVTLRKGSRDYFYEKLDKHFPEMKEKYHRKFGYDYHCPPDNYMELKAFIDGLMEKLGLDNKVPVYAPQQVRQPGLF